MRKYKKVILICSIILTFLIVIVCFSGIYLANMFIPNSDDEKAITQYKSIFNAVIEKDFVNGEIDSEEGICVLYLSDGSTEKIYFKTEFKRPFISDIYKSKEDNIVLFISNGIFGSDDEIIYTTSMIIDVSKYTNIKELTDNIYLCELRY